MNEIIYRRNWSDTFRSLLSSAGGLVLSKPARYLGIKEGETALVSRIGESIFSLVLDAPDSALDHLVSREGIEKTTRSELSAVVELKRLVLRLKRGQAGQDMIAYWADLCALDEP